MKIYKIFSLVLIILLISNCKDINQKDNSIELFYFLNKNTNKIEEYPNIEEYNAIVIDLFDTTKKEIKELKDMNKKVFCYFSAGSYENWREDKDKFNTEDLGNKLEGWNGENWIDIRNENIVNIMKDRIQIAKNKGCYGIDFDNVDGYTNNTGFNLSFEDQLKYNKELSRYTHSLGLKTILKNDLSQINDLINDYDYAVNESCNVYNECNLYENWLKNKKYVFNIEYSVRNDLYKHKYFKTYFSNTKLNGIFYEKAN